MQLRIDEQLVEAVVLQTAGKIECSPLSSHASNFFTERERLYELSDPDARHEAFCKFNLSWFKKWNFHQRLLAPLEHFPRITSLLQRLAFCKAIRPTDEGAELYVNSCMEKTAIISLQTERFEPNNMLEAFLYHELQHLDDMLNPAFGYKPELPVTIQFRVHQKLIRERYRLLWNISIHGRLCHAGKPSLHSLDSYRMELDRLFSFWPADKRQAVMQKFLSDLTPCHDELLNYARDPAGFKDVYHPMPGSPCPLCGFPTHDWSDIGALDSGLVASIKSDFPTWEPSQGLCRQCLEIYRQRSRKVFQETKS